MEMFSEPVKLTLARWVRRKHLDFFPNEERFFGEKKSAQWEENLTKVSAYSGRNEKKRKKVGRNAMRCRWLQKKF